METIVERSEDEGAVTFEVLHIPVVGHLRYTDIWRMHVGIAYVRDEAMVAACE